jgi:glycosyltransferase involved in cell wall biosynthesis
MGTQGVAGGTHLKILHVITGLEAGGAETMLLKLLTQFRAESGPEGEVICLAQEGPLAAPIRALGVPVTSLGLRGTVAAVLGLGRLTGLIRRSRADLVQCWMYHANLMGGVAARAAGGMPVIWGLRQSNLDPNHSKRGTIAVARWGARFSHMLPRQIVCVSQSARDVHAAMGYDAARMTLIPNGFDLDLFRPDAAARAALRDELGIGETMPLIGLAARFDPQKDIPTFLAAAVQVRASHPDTHFILCGEGMSPGHDALATLVAPHGLADHLHLLGRRSDMPRITAAFDIAVSSSAFGEGFSNTLGEALACGVPVAATNVGDSALITGEAGRIVAPGAPDALAGAINDLIALGPEGRALLGAAGRARMARDYGLAAIAARYQGLYDGILGLRQGGS